MSDNEPTTPASALPEDVRVAILPIERTQYFNGFEMAIGTADVVLTLKVNNQPITTLNCSFTTAKTLVHGLTKIIGALEESTDHNLMTIDDIKAAGPKMKETMAAKMKDKSGRKVK